MIKSKLLIFENLWIPARPASWMVWCLNKSISAGNGWSAISTSTGSNRASSNVPKSEIIIQRPKKSNNTKEKLKWHNFIFLKWINQISQEHVQKSLEFFLCNCEKTSSFTSCGDLLPSGNLEANFNSNAIGLRYCLSWRAVSLWKPFTLNLPYTDHFL